MAQQITACCRDLIKILCCITNNFQNMKIAIEKDNYIEFISYFEKNKLKVQDYEEDTGNNPLHLTVKANRYDMVEYILNKQEGLEREDKNFDGDTALMLAVLFSDLRMVKLLVEKGNVDVNCKESEGFTPFMASCANGKLDIVEYLMNNKECKIYSKNNQGQTAIHRAAFYGEVKVIQKLINNNPKQLTQRDSRGNTCLHFAAMRLNMTCFRYILKKLGDQKEAELKKKNQEGLTPVQMLIKSFNMIKKDDKAISEEDVIKYIEDKNQPPLNLYESLKEQKPNLFNKLETQKEQLIQKPGSKPLPSKQMVSETNQEQTTKKNLQVTDNQIQEQEMQNLNPSMTQLQDQTKFQNSEQYQKPTPDIEAIDNTRPQGLKSPIQGESVHFIPPGAASTPYNRIEENETEQLKTNNRINALFERRKHNQQSMKLNPLSQLSKKNI